MANRDFINILREIRGSAAPGEPLTDGIWYELTAADKNGNDGIYGDILAKYGIVTESAGTFDQAVAILENLNVEITTIAAGLPATSALVNGVWQLGIPEGTAGIDGTNGFTPDISIQYNDIDGNVYYTVTVDGVETINEVLLNLDTLVDQRVIANVDVQTTLDAKQEVVDAVAVAQAIADGLDANVDDKITELNDHTITKIAELDSVSINEKQEISDYADTKVAEYDANALVKTTQYNDNHDAKLAAYNSNDSTKISQYNANHVDRLDELNYAYADRIVDLIKTQKVLGIIDRFDAVEPTQTATFLATGDPYDLYYLNGVLMEEGVDFTIVNETIIDLTNSISAHDTILQINSNILGDLLVNEDVLFWDHVGVANGVASLDANGLVPSTQLPSYVDDVLEFATVADLPVAGELDKIYVVIADETTDSGGTSTYRWTGTVYAKITDTMSAADVKALYESNSDTNAFTDVEKAKLLAIEEGATADQTDVEIEALYEGLADTNKYTDAEKTLVGVETVLNTTATTLPTAVNEVHEELGVHKSSDGSDHTFIDQDVTTTATPTFAGIMTGGLVDGRDVSVDGTKLDSIEDGATADQTDLEIEALYEGLVNTNKYTDAEKTLVDVAAGLDTTATTLPSAINEVHGEVDAHIADTVDAHDASAISVNPATLSQFTATQVQELAEQIDPIALGVKLVGNNVLVTGCELTINADPTKFDISAGVFYIVDNYTDPLNPVYIKYEYAGATGIAPTYAGTQLTSYICFDTTGALVQLSSLPSSGEDLRDYLLLGVTVHPSTTIVSVSNSVNTTYAGLGTTVTELGQAVGRITSGNIYSAASNDLTIKKSAGMTFGVASNFKTDKKNPNYTLQNEVNPVTFSYYYRDGAGGWNVTSGQTNINTEQYDDNSGTLVNIPSNDWTIQRVYFASGSGTTIILHGQYAYPNLTDALENLPIDIIEMPSIVENLIFRGWVVVKDGCTDLSDSLEVKFISANKFGDTSSTSGGVGLTTVSLQQAYINSSEPEIVTDSNHGSVTIKNGTGTDTDLTLEGKNYAEDTTFSVDGEGNIELSGTVDGRDIAADGLVLDNLDANAIITNYAQKLAALDITNISYNVSGDPETITYEGVNNQEIVTYDGGGNPINIAHYYNSVTAVANTVITYDVDDNPTSTIYTEV